MSERPADPDSQHARTSPALRLAAMVAAAVALYALAGFFAVPPLVRWIVQKRGSEALHRPVSLGEVAFNPFTLEARADDLRIRDRDGQPLFSLARLQLRLGPSGIFRRAWRLRELTLHRPALQVRFLRDGTLSFADLLRGDEESPTHRVVVDHLSIREGRIDMADEGATPPFRTSFAPLNADIRELITIPGQRGEHAASIGFDGHSAIRITGRQSLQPLAVSGRIELRRIALASLAQRLVRDAPLALRSGQADVALDYDLRKEAAGMQLRVSHGQLTATGVAVTARGDNAELLTVPRLEIRDAELAFPARRVAVGSIRAIEPVTAIGWDPHGRFNWSSPQAGTAANEREGGSAPGRPWTLNIARAGVERGTLRFDDRQTATPVRFDLTGVRIDATGISNDGAAPVALSAVATSGSSGKLSLHGTLVPSPFSLDLQSSLSAIELLPFQPYTASIRGLTLAAGSAGFNGRMLFSSAQPFLVEGEGVVNGIEFVDAAKNRLLGCRNAALRQMRVDGATSRYRIRRVDLDGMYANVVIDRQRNLNLSAIGAAPAGETPVAPGKGSFDIGTINVVNSTIDYRDDSLVLPFSTAITSTRGTIRDFSTTSAAAATIRLGGNVAQRGAMAAQGTLRLADPFAGTDLSVHFRSVPMPVLTPYAAEFAGYEIVRGALDLDLKYRIVDRKLNGDHRVVAAGLTLGKRVGGTKAGFAVRLAIALLKDHEGKINLEVPIEGSVDSPQFNYRVVFWQAVKTILGNVVKAPFRALGHAMGMGGEDLQLVAFEPGESALMVPEVEKLKKIAGELAARPELALEIEGPFDPKLDVRAMKAAKLASLIEARQDAPAAGEPASLETILESLYVEAFSPDRLAQERAKYTTTPPPPPTQPARHVWRRTPSPPPPPPPVFDANAFYDAIRAQLLESQAISADDLHSLGRARAEAIAAALTSGGMLARERVRALDPGESKKGTGTHIVAEMKLSAKDGGSDSPD